jgi:hypothetical protein
MSYKRVIPRDFFNESKLLKCLGKIELYLMGNKNISVQFDNERFLIEQNDSDGSLYVSNYKVYIGEDEVSLYIPYNCKENWPLMADYCGSTYYLLNESGDFIPSVITDFIKGRI